VSKKIKAALGIALFAVWGPYLFYVWMVPQAVPGWVAFPGARRALMLSRDLEPTFFTLMFAVMFTAIAAIGLYRLATDQLPE
jgi:hypothetical protein